MTFAWSQSSKKVDEATAADFLQQFLAGGHRTVDTARIYAGGNSEKMLGAVLQKAGNRDAIELVTKAHPSQPEGLSPAGLRSQLTTSLEAMGVAKVDVLYLHQPDTNSPLTDTLECTHALMQEGLVAAFGLSNYSAVEVERCVAICKEKGYALPVVYQGLYNAINRRVEAELFPVLRANNIAFVAYNPLAAGLLTGKHAPEGDVKAGRFKVRAARPAGSARR